MCIYMIIILYTETTADTICYRFYRRWSLQPSSLFEAKVVPSSCSHPASSVVLPPTLGIALNHEAVCMSAAQDSGYTPNETSKLHFLIWRSLFDVAALPSFIFLTLSNGCKNQ